jgi:hypothetical protein
VGVDQAAADLAVDLAKRQPSSHQSNLLRSFYSFFLRRRTAHHCVCQMFAPAPLHRRHFQVIEIQIAIFLSSGGCGSGFSPATH